MVKVLVHKKEILILNFYVNKYKVNYKLTREENPSLLYDILIDPSNWLKKQIKIGNDIECLNNNNKKINSPNSYILNTMPQKLWNISHFCPIS